MTLKKILRPLQRLELTSANNKHELNTSNNELRTSLHRAKIN